MDNVRRGFLGLAVVALLAVALPATASACASCCDPCCQPTCTTCCAPPPPVAITLCLKDPCTCCTYEVELCVPAECAGEAPCINWRSGLLGRRIAELCWPCCDHSAKVIVTRHGKVKVR